MQPRPIAETIGPPRPSFRCFILVEIRLSLLSQSRSHQATAPQSFSIYQREDGEIRASMHATFAVENFLLGAAHRPYRRVLGDRDDEDARESDGSVHCADGIRRDWPDRSTEGRDTRFWPPAHGR